MAHGDKQDARDSAFTAIRLSDLLGRGDVHHPDAWSRDASTRPFASVDVLPRCKGDLSDVAPEGVQPRADRTFTGLSEPRRRPITSAGVVLAISSLAGATLMLGDPTLVPPEPSTLDQPGSGQNADDVPLSLISAVFPGPFVWVDGLGLPASARSRGVVPSLRPPSGARALARSSAARTPLAPASPADGPIRTLADVLAYPSTPSRGHSSAATHSGSTPDGEPKQTAGTSTPTVKTHRDPSAATNPPPISSTARTPREPAGSALSSLTPAITAQDAAHTSRPPQTTTPQTTTPQTTTPQTTTPQTTTPQTSPPRKLATRTSTKQVGSRAAKQVTSQPRSRPTKQTTSRTRTGPAKQATNHSHSRPNGGGSQGSGNRGRSNGGGSGSSGHPSGE